MSEIGFGSWAIGADWGDVEEKDAIAALNAALDSGVTMIDTADVYGDGRAEKLIAKMLKGRGGARPVVARAAPAPTARDEPRSVRRSRRWVIVVSPMRSNRHRCRLLSDRG